MLIEFRGHNDGSITDVKVIDSSNVKFARSIERAVPQWRLKPWKASAEIPDSATFRQILYFNHLNEGHDVHRWTRRYIRRLSCSKFNKALATVKSNAPGRELQDMHYVIYTLNVLARSATRHKMTNEQRAELGDEFVRAIPNVVDQCAARPELRYKEALPESIRALL